MDYPEYKPISHWCDCCECEIDDEEEVFEVEPFKWFCADCFKDYVLDDFTPLELAHALGYTVRKACET